jgi:glycosyltransferase involved in cell wall biosynthesis
MKITATIITLNEEKNIKDVILSARNVCDEIIVVDSKSTDNTVSIAKKLANKVYVKKYQGDGPQKQFGVQYAKNDWILSLDADERLDHDAISAIKKINLQNTKHDAFSFARKNFVGKSWIKAAGFYPDLVVRLYNKNKACYANKKAHSHVAANKIKRLNAHIIHYTYNNYSHWIERINTLSTRDAWAMQQQDKKVNKLTPITHALVAFVRKFFFKGGCFQGIDGMTVTITTVFHVYMKYLKLLELQQNEKSNK